MLCWGLQGAVFVCLPTTGSWARKPRPLLFPALPPSYTAPSSPQVCGNERMGLSGY